MKDFNSSCVQFINNARNNPQITGKSILQNLQNNFYGDTMTVYGHKVDTFQGIQAVYNLNNYMGSIVSRTILQQSLALNAAAQAIANQKGLQGLTTHQAPRKIYERVSLNGHIQGKIGELIMLQGTKPEEVITNLLIDDGLVSRKRRKMLLDPTYSYIGVGRSIHTKYNFITVILLAEKVTDKIGSINESRITKQKSSKVEENKYQMRQTLQEY